MSYSCYIFQSEKNTIDNSDTTNDHTVGCQRCEQSYELTRCNQCQWVLCQECDQSIHVGQFELHQRTSLESLNHEELTQQCNAIKQLEVYCNSQESKVQQHFENIISQCNVQRSKLLDQIDKYRTQQQNDLQQRLNLIKSALKQNAIQTTTIPIPNHIQHTTESFNLPSCDSLKLLIKQIDFLKQQQPVSPRRGQTPQKRNASQKRIEPLEEHCHPLEKRKFIQFLSQANAILVRWNNCLQKVDYQLELGIGIKQQGVEQFKQVYSGEDQQYIVYGLQAKTTYRFRVQAIQGDRKSELSEILSVQTPFNQSIEDNPLVSRKFLSQQEVHVIFEKPGVVLGTNAIYFGIATWEVKLIINGIVEDLTASIVLGVGNKQRKLIGSTFNYGYQRESLVVRVHLNLDQKYMLITSKMNPNGEKFNNINGPIYPGFQNKNSHKGSGQLKKLQNVVDKEVLNLTGGLYPAALLNQSRTQPHREWVLENIKLRNPTISGIKAWVPTDERGQIFPGEKYNIDPELIEFTAEDIEPSDWTYEETKYLFEQLRFFNYNFIVLQDRYDYSQRDIYELKHRYYTVVRQLLVKRNQVTHPLYSYTYDPDYDRYRNMELEKYLKRTKVINEEEKKLMEELKKIEQQIRKSEKEHKSLAKCMNIRDTEDIDENQVSYIVQMYEKNIEVKNKLTERIVYLRSRWINDALPIPAKIQKKLEFQLKELLPSSRLVLNQEFEEIHGKLRQVQLAVLSQQRLEKRRESEKRSLEERLKKLKQQVEQQQQGNELKRQSK